MIFLLCYDLQDKFKKQSSLKSSIVAPSVVTVASKHSSLVFPIFFYSVAPGQYAMISFAPFSISFYQIHLLQVMNSVMVPKAKGNGHYME